MNLREVIILTATYYGKTLSEPVLEMYVEDLDDLPNHAVIAAYRTYRRDPKHKFFPLPAQIREIIEPEVSHDAIANESVARIVESITRFGYMRGTEARVYIGDIGWAVVRRFGGWDQVCRHHGEELSPGQFFAQARSIAMSHLELAKHGRLGEAPMLEESMTSNGLSIEHSRAGLQSAHEILNSIQIKTTNKG